MPGRELTASMGLWAHNSPFLIALVVMVAALGLWCTTSCTAMVCRVSRADMARLWMYYRRQQLVGGPQGQAPRRNTPLRNVTLGRGPGPPRPQGLVTQVEDLADAITHMQGVATCSVEDSVSVAPAVPGAVPAAGLLPHGPRSASVPGHGGAGGTALQTMEPPRTATIGAAAALNMDSALHTSPGGQRRRLAPDGLPIQPFS